MARFAALPASLAATLAIALTATPAAGQPQDKAPWGALTDVVRAGEIVLRDVCLPAILEKKPIDELAHFERLIELPGKAANAGPNDKAWRLASLSPVYAVAWADGSCSTYVYRGPTAKLRAMAEATILARPEGFQRGSSGEVPGRGVERTVFCAYAGDERLVVTITTPVGRAPSGTRSLSSTAYRATGTSALCDPSGAATAP
jgi:hypothetical protein